MAARGQPASCVRVSTHKGCVQLLSDKHSYCPGLAVRHRSCCCPCMYRSMVRLHMTACNLRTAAASLTR